MTGRHNNFKNLPLPLFAKEGNKSSLWQREVRHNVLNLSNLKARGLSFKVRKTIGSEPQLRRTGYE